MADSVKDSAADVLYYLRTIGKKPLSMQIGIGGGAGVFTGYVFGKSSRLLAGTLGCSLIVLQFCNYRGYIVVSRSEFEKDLRAARRALEKQFGANKSSVPSAKEVDKFLISNKYLLGGFVAGCLLGYAFS
uniref:FUN14 domain-containing protein 1 n=1 Tax=Steinernema glaseri TaxID=37863 RepID=A0A1I7ZAF1_9BILA